ncbi:MAG: leucine-rich repeat protein [Muribaculaceae bacterium]|nr:leucine-rich repeat protein [Muribaculaceae bacterium]
MMKKFLLFVFAATACLLTASAATDYGIKVNGTSITSDNLSFSTGGGTVSYNTSTCTLTLSNVSINRTGSGNQALRIYTSSNRSSALTVVFNGTCTLSAANADAVVMEDAVDFTVNGTTTIYTTASGQYAVRVFGNKIITFEGPGSLSINASDGVACKGESGSDWISFKIYNCSLNGQRGNFVNFSKVRIYAYNTNLSQSTTITLKPTKSSSYPHVQSIGSWTLGTDVHLASPTGATTSNLETAANYNKTFVFNDERDNPNWTKVGDFQYTTYTESGVTYARLMKPTMAFKQSAPTYITVPGYVTLNGTKYRVRVAGSAFINMDNVTTVRFEYGVHTLESMSLSYLTKLSKVYIPSSVKYIGNSFLCASGGSASGNTTTVYWAQLEPSASLLHESAFSDCYATTRSMVMPTYPAITKAKAISKVTSYFTVNSTPQPHSAYDIRNNNNYYVVTNMGSSSVQPEAALTGSDVMGIIVHYSPSIGTDGYLSRSIYCTSVAEQAFKYNTNISDIDIRSSDVSINKEAFYGCTAMTSATISAKNIYEDAFAGCTALTTVTLDEGVQYVASRAFENTAISTLNIPATLTTFAVTAVDGCKKLEKFTVASGNSYYSTYSTYGALYNKAQTKLIKHPAYNASTFATAFPTTMTEINDYAFSYNCRASYIELPYGVTKMGSSYGRIFMNATTPQVIKIPSSVTSICYTNTFYGCTNLKKLLIATYANAKTVNSYTFYNVPSTMRVYVPSSWDNLDDDASAAYYSYDYWKNYNVTHGAWDAVIGGLPYLLNTWTDNGYRTAYLVYGTHISNSSPDYNLQPSGSLNLPEKVNYNGTTYITLLAPHAFENNINITSVTINQPLLGKGFQFHNCTKLRTVNFGTTKWARNTVIPVQCFRNSRVVSVSIPYGCSAVGDLAFADNPNLTTINVPSSCYNGGLAHVASNFVRNCSGLNMINLNIINPSYMNNPYGWPTVKDVAPDDATYGCFYNVPKDCKLYVPTNEMENYYDYTSSNGHKIWQYFTNVGLRVIQGAYDYYVPGKGHVTFTGDIDDQYSDQMHTAKFVYAPDDTTTVARMGVRNYGTYDFIVTDLSPKCFVSSKIKQILIDWDNVTMTEIPDEAFTHSPLESFPWNGKIARIGQFAFAYCGHLAGEIDLSKCGTSGFILENSAFFYCEDVTSFVLPATTTYVGPSSMFTQKYRAAEWEGYSDWASHVLDYLVLESVTCKATTVPSRGKEPWEPHHQRLQTLYVPAESVSAYETASYWKNFGKILPIPDGLQGDVNGDGIVNGSDVTALYNVLLDNATPAGDADVNGDGIVNGSDVTALYNILLN